MHAVKRSSLEFRYRYTNGFDTPASSAISSIEAAMYPRRPKISTAASSICCSRTARGIRLLFTTPMRKAYGHAATAARALTSGGLRSLALGTARLLGGLVLLAAARLPGWLYPGAPPPALYGGGGP